MCRTHPRSRAPRGRVLRNRDPQHPRRRGGNGRAPSRRALSSAPNGSATRATSAPRSREEKLIKQSSIPYSIVHATQFFEFLSLSPTPGPKATPCGSRRSCSSRWPPTMSPPRLRRSRSGVPLNGTVEVGDPEQFRFDEFVRHGLRALGDGREVVSDPNAPYYGYLLSERSLVPGDGAELGPTRFDDWLSRRPLRSDGYRRVAAPLRLGAATQRGGNKCPLTEAPTDRAADRSNRPATPTRLRRTLRRGRRERKEMLRGRAPECARLDALLRQVKSGRSETLVLRGEAGVGKTASSTTSPSRQWAGASPARAASNRRWCRVRGRPSPVRADARANRSLAGAAAERDTGRVRAVGRRCTRSFPCCARSLEPARRDGGGTAAHVHRRRRAMGRPGIAASVRVRCPAPLGRSSCVALRGREPDDAAGLQALPELVVGGIGDREARRLLDETVPGRLDERVRDRIVADARGNPLALLELPRGLTPAVLAGGFGLPSALPLPNRIQQLLHAVVADRVTRETRLAPRGGSHWRCRAALAAVDHLGIRPDAVAVAEGSGRSTSGRGARTAPARPRRGVPRREAERPPARASRRRRRPIPRLIRTSRVASRARDRGLDERLADELERCANRGSARSGIAAAAAFLERSTELTPDPGCRSRGALDAADAKLEAAAPDVALHLLAIVERRARRPAARAARAVTRADRIVRTRGRSAPRLLLDAAKRLVPLDAALARRTYLDALEAAIYAGRLGHGGERAKLRKRPVPPRRLPSRRRQRPPARWPGHTVHPGLCGKPPSAP